MPNIGDFTNSNQAWSLAQHYLGGTVTVCAMTADKDEVRRRQHQFQGNLLTIAGRLQTIDPDQAKKMRRVAEMVREGDMSDQSVRTAVVSQVEAFASGH
jgi:hypothetical protein